MSTLLFLSSDDFYVTKGTKGDILCNSISGFSLILFYSTQCNYCKDLIPIFKSLPGSIGGCQFGLINVSAQKAIIGKSKDTITPIKYVPYIVLYINGKPFMLYQGPYIANEIKKFIFEVSQKINSKQEFSSSENIKQKTKNSIPSYTIGIPKCDDDVCYLEFDEAYDK
jgi:thioredoxin-like negative regulator of GroEL